MNFFYTWKCIDIKMVKIDRVRTQRCGMLLQHHYVGKQTQHQWIYSDIYTTKLTIDIHHIQPTILGWLQIVTWFTMNTFLIWRKIYWLDLSMFFLKYGLTIDFTVVNQLSKMFWRLQMVIKWPVITGNNVSYFEHCVVL